MARDYYDILGVSKSATDDEIKKAYRRKAMELHPDKHKGDKTVEDNFKEVNKAYEVLGDKQKRAAYDQFGEAGVNFGAGGGGAGGAGFGGANGFNGFGFDFNGFKADFNNGNDSFSDIFEAFFTGFGARNNAPRKGRNLEFELRISFEEAAFGTEKELIVTRPGNGGERKEENLKIKIPAGVDTGSVIRLSGKGDPGANGGPQGDLYVHINVAGHKIFTREGYDRPHLYVHINVAGHKIFTREGYDLGMTLDINVLQAVLGDEVTIKTLDQEVTLKIPAGTQPNKIFKLKGYGVSKLNSSEKGDLLVKVNVVIPTKLSKKEKQYYQEMAEESGQKSKGKGFWK